MNVDKWINYDRLNIVCSNLVVNDGIVECYYPPTIGKKPGFIYQILYEPKGFSQDIANTIWLKISTFLDHNYPKLTCQVTWYKSKLPKFRGFIRIKLLKKGTFSRQNHKFEKEIRGLDINNHLLFSNLYSHLRIINSNRGSNSVVSHGVSNTTNDEDSKRY